MNVLPPRIGRTGRVGNTGRATSFFDERENAALARPLVKVVHYLHVSLMREKRTVRKKRKRNGHSPMYNKLREVIVKEKRDFEKKNTQRGVGVYQILQSLFFSKAKKACVFCFLLLTGSCNLF